MVKENDQHLENVFIARGIPAIIFTNSEVEDQIEYVLKSIIVNCNSRIILLSPLTSGEGQG